METNEEHTQEDCLTKRVLNFAKLMTPFTGDISYWRDLNKTSLPMADKLVCQGMFSGIKNCGYGAIGCILYEYAKFCT